MTDKLQDLSVIGGGTSGAALLYLLARYADLPSQTLLDFVVNSMRRY